MSAKVTIEHCEQNEWFTKRAIEEVVIPMIPFIEEGMTIPMGKVMRDFLILVRLYPT